ncbi:MBL fold metallo-hydrolase [Vibrio neptunius]|uniref:MBL fold metallo-hydrolase n=1 Tax=Vibrio neptunius TaxID=170651 RepID=UPI001C5CB8C9|nr:MBL fold metallo-hydrolase [Vibrio neptunius]QXX05483.1 MBL fold metallo-hydrolase [Vibrio neptunius]
MKLHTIDGYIQKMYLAEYPDKLMLLDGASRADVPYLERYITETLGKPFHSLKVVVVTHMHPDHAGAAHKLRELTGCKIVSAEKDKQWYGGWDGILMHLTDLALARWVAGRMKRPKRKLWYSRNLHPDIKLTDGQAIPCFEDWKVLETPGHTDRDLSLHHEQQDILYVADLMVEVKKRLIAPFPIFHPNKYRHSLHRVHEMAPKTLLLAHGGEVQFDQSAYDHLLRVAPRTPATHWRATKVKLRGLLGALWAFGVKDKR